MHNLISKVFTESKSKSMVTKSEMSDEDIQHDYYYEQLQQNSYHSTSMQRKYEEKPLMKSWEEGNLFEMKPKFNYAILKSLVAEQQKCKCTV